MVGCGLEIMRGEIKYELHVLNKVGEGNSEFSMDHAGLFSLYVGATLVLAVMTIMANLLAKRHVHRGSNGVAMKDHPYIQLLLLCLGVSLGSCGCFVLHYYRFAHDGLGSKRIRFLGVLAGCVANCSVLLIAMLSSVGWAISEKRLPMRRCLLGGVALIGGLGALCELHAQFFLDESTKIYSYQSPAGLLSLVLKLFMFCWFAFHATETHESAAIAEHKRFYKLMGVCFSTWILNAPVVVILAFYLPPWNRLMIVTSVDVVARVVSQGLLVALFFSPWSPVSADNTYSAREPMYDDSFGKMQEMDVRHT